MNGIGLDVDGATAIFVFWGAHGLDAAVRGKDRVQGGLEALGRVGNDDDRNKDTSLDLQIWAARRSTCDLHRREMDEEVHLLDARPGVGDPVAVVLVVAEGDGFGSSLGTEVCAGDSTIQSRPLPTPHSPTRIST